MRFSLCRGFARNRCVFTSACREDVILMHVASYIELYSPMARHVPVCVSSDTRIVRGCVRGVGDEIQNLLSQVLIASTCPHHGRRTIWPHGDGAPALPRRRISTLVRFTPSGQICC
jgi:hypothetical protein